MKEKIKKLVEAETGIQDISIKSRKQNLVEARVVFSTLCLRHTNDSYERIAQVIKRDHSTIVHCRKIYNNWVDCPKLYLNNLTLLDTIDNLINEQKDTTEKEIDIITRYRKKNILLTKELQKLKDTINRQEAKIKKLKKYEPIW
tara:strand:+ start:1430 stop:1861 length:432 start_codon:yes stop_codon:yes gene_type:complete